jgi:hypothetical protein
LSLVKAIAVDDEALPLKLPEKLDAVTIPELGL